MGKSEIKPGCVKTLSDLAVWADVDRRTVIDWKKKDGFPVEPDGTYHVFKVGEWRANRNHETSKPENILEGVDLNEVKALRMVAEKEIAQEEAKAKALKNRQAEGELVSRDAVKRWLSGVFTYLRQRYEAFPVRIASRFPEDIRVDLLDETQRFVALELRYLSQQSEKYEENIE